MSYLVAAVVVVGAVGLLNLVLMYGVIRRLREHHTRLADLPGAGQSAQIGLPVGSTVGEFTATTIAGAVLSRDDLVGGWLVGFLSTTCLACEEKLPAFLKWIAGRDRVIVVVEGEAAAIVHRVTEEAPDAHFVTATTTNRGIVEAFGVRGFPVFFVIGDGGVVRAVDHDVAALGVGVSR